MKRNLCVLVMVLMTVYGWSEVKNTDLLETWATVGICDTTWYNEETKVFTLSTPAELGGLAYLVNKSKIVGDTILLSADIDLSAHSWMPIGYTNAFSGVFDGQGHTISGIKDLEYLDNAGGFFGNLCFAFISNLNFSADNDIALYGVATGSVAGLALLSAIYNCHNEAAVHGDINVGGILGNGSLVSIFNCSNYGFIAGDGDMNGIYGTHVGGIVGSMSGSVCNSYNMGAVNGVDTVGGIIGIGSSLTIKNCYSHGAVEGGSAAGGIIAVLTDAKSTVAFNNYWQAADCNQSSDFGTKKDNAWMKSSTGMLAELNDSVDANNLITKAILWEKWEIVEDKNNGYPIFVSSTTGVNEVLAADMPNVYVANREIMVAGIAGKTLSMYNISGQLITNKVATTDYETLKAPDAGIYIVRIDNTAVKLVVK